MAPVPFQRRDAGAPSFEALVLPHLERLYRLAYRYTGTSADAEDLVQSLLVKLLPQQETLTRVELLAPWLARALHNLYVDQVRRRTTSAIDLAASQQDEEALELIVDDKLASPDEVAEKLSDRDWIAAALMRLTPEHRALIAWHDIEGYTLEELAGSRNIPLGTLKSRLHRARAHLRQLLMEPYGAALRVTG